MAPRAPALAITADADADPDVSQWLEAAESDQTAAVSVYRHVPGVRPPGRWVGELPIAEATEPVIQAKYGGGDYTLKLRRSGGTFGPSRVVSIDGPARRIAPQFGAAAVPAYPAAPFPAGGWGGEPAAPPDPLAALMQRLDRMEAALAGRAAAPTDDRPSWRDLMELQIRGGAQSKGAELAEMAKFIELMRPKSTVEELIATAKLMRTMTRSGVTESLAPEPDGGGLAAVLAPLVPALMGALRSPEPAPARVPARVASVPSLPAARPAPDATPQPPARPAPAPPAPSADPPAPAEPPHVVKWGPRAAQLAPLVAHALASDPTLTAADLGDALADLMEHADAAELCADVPEGHVAGLIMRAAPELQAHAARLLLAEGVFRSHVAADAEDAADPYPEPEPAPPPPPAAPVRVYDADPSPEAPRVEVDVRTETPAPAPRPGKPPRTTRKAAAPARKTRARP